MATDKQEFKGFRKPEKNYFEMPNEWTDITCDIHSLAELKVVEYLLRHTWGYSKDDCKQFKFITIDEFAHGRKRRDGSRIDRGTGLSEKGVSNGLKLAVADGFIEKFTDDSDRARIKVGYRLRLLDGVEQNKSTASVNGTNVNACISKVYGPSPYDLQAQSVNFTDRTEKATIGKQLRKDTKTSTRSAVDSPYRGSISGFDEDNEKTDKNTFGHKCAKHLADSILRHDLQFKNKVLPYIDKWAIDIEKGIREYQIEEDHFWKVLDWYCSHITDRMMYQAYCGSSFVQKFKSIEVRMKQETEMPSNSSASKKSQILNDNLEYFTSREKAHV